MANLLALMGVKSMVAAGSVAVVATGTAIVYKDEIPKLFQPASVTTALTEVTQEPAALVRQGDTTKPVVTNKVKPVPVPKADEVTKTATIAPTFDILRVEKDGSMLVAGNAAPNALVDLVMADGSVIASVEAGPEGDFVVLPDLPLAPGDYVLSLRAVSGQQEPRMSTQTSPVTVPESGGELLAMISEAGKPSRIISKPEALEPEKAPEPKTEVAVAPVEEDKPVEPTAAEPVKKPVEAAVEPVEIAKVEPAPTPVEVAKVEPKVEVVKEPKPEAVEIAAVELPKAAKPLAEVKAVEPAPVQPVKTPEPAEVVVKPAEEAKPAPVEVAKAEPSPSPPPPQVIVEAVEVEGDEVYIAGAVPRGVPVRIYIDNVFIGMARGTSDNRFLVSKPYDLTEGEHAVRADVIDKSTGKVLTRAEVPLIHEIPEELKPQVEVAAVEAAPAPEPVKVEKPVEVAALETPARQPEKPKPIEPVAEVVQEVKKEVAAVVEAVKPQPKVVEPKVAEAVVEPRPQPVAKPVAIEPEVAIVEPKIKAPEPAATAAAVVPKVEVAVATPEPVVETPVAEPEKVVSLPVRAPSVLKTGRAVIIKRGDNLWRISRKTYGRGIRYTTIYNANRNQITDPDRIFIGQIFKIPQNAEQEG